MQLVNLSYYLDRKNKTKNNGSPYKKIFVFLYTVNRSTASPLVIIPDTKNMISKCQEN